MKLKEMFTLIRDEKQCEEFLRGKGVLKTFSECINCESDKIGIIRGDRYRCYKCKKEWSQRKGSILSNTRMNYSEFVTCIKLFELEFSAEKAAKELVVNYKTIKMLFMLLRKIISGLGDKEIKEYSGIIKKNTNRIYIRYSNDKVLFDLNNKDHSSSQVTAYRHRVQGGESYYEMEYRSLKDAIGKGKARGYLTKLDRFWRFARERLFSYRGTDEKYFILYLKEIEFRYNNRNNDLFNKIISILGNFNSGYL